MRVFNDPLLTNAVMNTTLTSLGIPLMNTYGYAIQAVYTGTPTGTFKLQASVDPVKDGPPNTPQPTNWDDITDSSFTVSSAGVYIWNVTDAMYTWVRLVYTDSSGGTSTAIVNARINSKGV